MLHAMGLAWIAMGAIFAIRTVVVAVHRVPRYGIRFGVEHPGLSED